jgi:hypothetical protein
VGAAIESGEDRQQLDAGRSVEELSRRYQELIAQLHGAEREQAERRVGRRVMDLRRAAEGLTKRASGTAVASAVDAGLPFLMQRAPGKSIEARPEARPRGAPRYHVGGEVEAWCGKCREMREHHIVAIVDGEPKQVICQTCRSRHGYRTEPSARDVARGAATPSASGDGGGTTKRVATAEQQEEARRMERRRALIKELDAVAEPRRFDPRGRYKVGEIIFHPEHGKGKIENVLKGSLLVRFREGLKPVNLF